MCEDFQVRSKKCGFIGVFCLFMFMRAAKTWDRWGWGGGGGEEKREGGRGGGGGGEGGCVGLNQDTPYVR